MNLCVIADDECWNEIQSKATEPKNLLRLNALTDLDRSMSADAVFCLTANSHLFDYSKIDIPVFIHSVTATLKEYSLPRNVLRINAWPGFINRSSWEVAGNLTAQASSILDAFAVRIVAVPDEPGLIAARVISMIVNEAYFALEENVSTENEIDIAMKLGTNYPLGPFEWAKKIGLKNIEELLVTLSKHDKRYCPSNRLLENASE